MYRGQGHEMLLPTSSLLSLDTDFHSSTQMHQFAKWCFSVLLQTRLIYTLKKHLTFDLLYNPYTHGPITTIFGTNVTGTKKVSNQNVHYFPTHLTSASALPGETENPEIASFYFNAACFFTKNTKRIKKYHLVTAELSKRLTG